MLAYIMIIQKANFAVDSHCDFMHVSLVLLIDFIISQILCDFIISQIMCDSIEQ